MRVKIPRHLYHHVIWVSQVREFGLSCPYFLLRDNKRDWEVLFYPMFIRRGSQVDFICLPSWPDLDLYWFQGECRSATTNWAGLQCMHVHHFEIEQGTRVSEVNEKYTSSFTKGVLLPIRAGGANWYCLPVLLVSAHYGYCSNGQYLQCQALLGGVRTRIEM